MPRFTKDPGLMSRATRRARASRPSGLSLVWRSAWIPVRRLAWSCVGILISGHAFCRAGLCLAGGGTAGINTDDAVDVDSGGDDVLRVQAARGYDLGDLGDGVLRGRCHDGAEVPGG